MVESSERRALTPGEVLAFGLPRPTCPGAHALPRSSEGSLRWASASRPSPPPSLAHPRHAAHRKSHLGAFDSLKPLASDPRILLCSTLTAHSRGDKRVRRGRGRGGGGERAQQRRLKPRRPISESRPRPVALPGVGLTARAPSSFVSHRSSRRLGKMPEVCIHAVQTRTTRATKNADRPCDRRASPTNAAHEPDTIPSCKRWR